MKVGKILLILAIVYVAIVAAFEGLLGYFQPEGASTLVITTTSPDGKPNNRVLSRLDHDGKLYVAANHWPRAWYRHALANPEVGVTLDGEGGDYRAIPVSAAEHDALQAAHGHGLVFRILTGFPPRYFVRLEPA